MPTSYPSAIDSFTNPSGTQTLASPDHALQHSDINDTVEAIETVIGTTSGTSVLKNLSVGKFAAPTAGGTLTTTTLSSGTISGVLVGTSTITGGTSSIQVINNSTQGSPAITGGTASVMLIGTSTIQGGTAKNQVLGTPTFTFASDATGDLFYRSAGGTVTRLGVGTNAQFLTTNGTTPSWGNAIVSGTTIASIATGTTASATYVDVPGGSLVISPTGTVRVQAWASGRLYNSGTTNANNYGIFLNGTVLNSTDVVTTTDVINGGIPYAINGQALLSGSGTVKIQHKTNGGTMSIETMLNLIYFSA